PLIDRLLAKGVHIPVPYSVEIGPDIDLDRISGEDVTIHAGCRISGGKTLIMPGVSLGAEAPATVHDCQLGRGVSLKGGFFADTCFLDGAAMGSGAHVREACLLEEKARGAHTVGLKHTILLPFVKLGSLINFCDCLMAGGTDEKNHSEVGSSYIHFNFTPNQDKATASLIGDVPRGVMLDQPPIFLGGQGGLAGPVRINYGVVVAAGAIVRKDLLKGNIILLGSPALSRKLPFHRGLYTQLRRIIDLNFVYLANLLALRRWYLDVRSRFAGPNPMGAELLKGAVDKLDRAVSERLKRLGQVAERMPRSMELLREISSGPSLDKAVGRKKEFQSRWPDISAHFEGCMDRVGDPSQRDRFFSMVEHAILENGPDYLSAIRGLDRRQSEAGTAWLQGLVDEITGQAWELLPSFAEKRPGP
ncbi:MAG: UDP-N-acetylglucosamine pyrophosphorylase, partial [Deltaproteobacteria bacterium]|nr:UDP-N-acetylglucosamine pyrophosphorylase [Deltaproteobacteria bacterium]